LLTDTHCHLNFDSFDSDRKSVIERSLSADVQRILNPGIDIETSLAALRLAESHSLVYCAVGVHPNSASNWTNLYTDKLSVLAKNKKVVAIGEIGLDYYRDETPKDVQVRAFCDQLILAKDLGMPIVIHCREAMSDLISIVSEWIGTLKSEEHQLRKYPGVFHSFSGNMKEAHQVVSMKFKIGITGPITFRKNDEIKQIVSELDLDHLLLETDAPFLTPHPYRGKRNEPSYIPYIAEKIASIKNVSPEYVASKTTQNSIEVFKW